MTSRFDVDLFAKYSRARGEAKRRLLGDLVQQNEGLTVTLVAQLLGRGRPRPGRRRLFGRLQGAEHLDREEALACGRVGMLKAIAGFRNPEKGGIAEYAAWKIRYELQCAIEKAQVVTIRRATPQDARPTAIVFEGAHSAYAAQRGDDLWCMLGFSTSHAQDLEPEEELQVPRERPPSAIAHFIERRCVFRPAARSVWSHVVRAYEQHAQLLGFPSAPWQLGKALRARGARWTEVGNPPQHAIAGVRLVKLIDIYRGVLASAAA